MRVGLCVGKRVEISISILGCNVVCTSGSYEYMFAMHSALKQAFWNGIQIGLHTLTCLQMFWINSNIFCDAECVAGYYGLTNDLELTYLLHVAMEKRLWDFFMNASRDGVCW